MDRLPMRITCSMSVYQRPKRTIRAIECIINQSINGWEALITGDGCKDFMDLVNSGYFKDLIAEADKKGNSLIINFLPINTGGFGYRIKNQHRNIARGKYFVFLDNDDCILPEHFENYLSVIEDTEFDFAYFNSFLKQKNMIRWTALQQGHIGHSELIIKTEFLKKVPPHSQMYGHDWGLVQSMVRIGGKYTYDINKPYTYLVMSTPDLRETGID